MSGTLEGKESEVEAPRSSLRGVLFFVFKAVVTVGLITWLVRSGSLQMRQLGILVSSFEVMLATAAAWLSCSMALSSLRWRALLETVEIRISFPKAAALQTMALFFNGLVPGNMGGDFLKNHAVGGAGTRLVILVLLERVIGVASLIWTGAIGIFMSHSLLGVDRNITLLALLLTVMIVGSVVAPFLLLRLLPLFDPKEPETHVNKRGRRGVRRFVFAIARSSLDTMQLVRKSKSQVGKAIGISLLMHLGNMIYFLFLTQRLGNPEASFGQVAMALPLGILSLAVPISISGMGVGHVMFDELFEIVGLVGGATVFNVYVVAQLTPCLLGAIPYLFMRGKQR